MSFRFAELSSRRVIRVSGAEAASFLQGLVSNDLDRLEPGRGVFAALLSPQGKLLFDLILAGRGEDILIDTEAAQAADLAKRLKFYKLRAKVQIEIAEDLSVCAAFGGEVPDVDAAGLEVFPDPRLAALGTRLIGPKESVRERLAALGGTEADEAAYTEHRLALGVPEGADELGQEKLFLLEANFEALHGVDFKKGCYIGQELTARMKHKTELRKRLLPLQVAGGAEAGTPVTAGERTVGDVIGMRGNTVFALIRLDRLAETGSDSLKAGEAPARLAPTAYLEGAA